MPHCGTKLPLCKNSKNQHGGKLMSLTANQNKFIDPVCNMTIKPGGTEIKAIINGETYYFCAESCRKSFEENPQKFLDLKPAKKKGLWCRYLERLDKTSGGKSIKCH
jgi:YHS domain-containing protein